MDFIFAWKVNLFLILCGFCYSKEQERCPKTSIIRNGKVRFQSRGGITAVYTCDSGFVLRGSNVSHCQTDGHWSAPTPTCVPEGQSCSSSEMEMIRLSPGKSVNLSCTDENSNGETHIMWTSNDNSALRTFYVNRTLTTTSNSQGLYMCFSYSSTEVYVLRAVNVTMDYDKSMPSQLRKRTCDITFKDNTSNITSTIGSKISITCEVTKFHDSDGISWLKDGKPLILDKAEYRLTRLDIQNLQLSDEGNYTCVSHHKYTHDCTASKSVIVRVISNHQGDVKKEYACGQPIVSTPRRSKRVIDGSRAAPQSVPWMGMLSFDREPPFCGCSLVSDLWIVTAAHCFRSAKEDGPSYFMSQEEISKRVRVKFGKQQRRQVEKDEVVRSIQRLMAHPEFTPISGEQHTANEHDIALGKLSQKITFQPNILPICLPPPGFLKTIHEGTLGIVTGWGRVSVRDSVMAFTLQEAYLPLVNISSCQASTSYVITDNMLCAGYAESYRPDTCFGDSGGPFVLQKSMTWYLVGVVSWGEGCSSPRKFGIYTKVENYVPWISSVIEEGKQL